MYDYFRITKEGSERILSEWGYCTCGVEDKEHYHTRILGRITDTKVWKHVVYTARWDFDPRCKELKLPVPSWSRFDRFLGREFCLLFWAVENQTIDKVHVICQKWAALRPPERWWLFLYALSSVGWRKALPLMLGGDEVEVMSEIDRFVTLI